MNRKSILLASALALVFPGAYAAATLRVPAEYATIQAALDAARDGDTVLVGPGEYHVNLNLGAVITLRAESGPGDTILRSAGNLAYGPLDVPVVRVDSESRFWGVTLEGFTITGGSYGFLCGQRSRPIIRNNVFTSNSRANVCVEFAARPQIVGNQILRCEGPGVLVKGSPLIERNLIAGNSPGVFIAGQGEGVRLLANTITNNWSGDWMSGRPPSAAGILVENVMKGGMVEIENCIVAGNFNWWGAPDMANVLASAVRFSLIGDLNLCGWNGNVCGDPRFVSGGAWTWDPDLRREVWSPGDYHLRPDSPGIDAGNPASPFDPDDTRADIGAYYYHQLACCKAEDMACSIDEQTVTIAWRNRHQYEGFAVLRDGAMLVELPGNVEEYVDNAAPEGPHTYQLIAYGFGSTCDALKCSVEVSPRPRFLRGDANGDGALDIGDVIVGLDVMFNGVAAGCEDAIDVNDDGSLSLSDAVGLLMYLFAGGLPPQPPFPEPGADPRKDSLSCGRS